MTLNELSDDALVVMSSVFYHSYLESQCQWCLYELCNQNIPVINRYDISQNAFEILPSCLDRINQLFMNLSIICKNLQTHKD